MTEIQKKLFALQDPEYRAFTAKLNPTLDPETIIGVRIPKLRTLAKELKNAPEVEEFLQMLPHNYFDENNLHAFLIEKIKDYDTCIAETEHFLPYVDNWATCDSMSPKVFKKHLGELEERIKVWIHSDKTYTIRFAIEMLMTWFLDEHFEPKYLKMVADVRSEEYYVNMMIAWFFATALAKQYDAAIGYIENRKLSEWCHKKTIQKAIESYRITDEQKQYLRSLK